MKSSKQNEQFKGIENFHENDDDVWMMMEMMICCNEKRSELFIPTE